MGCKPSKILAFDTSAAQCAAVLVEGGQIRARRVEPMQRGQAERLMPLLEECLVDACLESSDLDRIAICIGPGNFTGIRIAVAAARGLALATGVPALGVTFFEALAASRNGPVVAVARNPRGAPYVQVFPGDAGKPSEITDAQTEIRVPVDATCVGFDAERIAGLMGLNHFLEVEVLDPEWIARAAAHKQLDTRSSPAPLYLRPADALTGEAPPPLLLGIPHVP
ncbi:MAG: tRNA (adenosine(37)-N6)-threonylcarbamoyltransferase complex dimerization subunit type 1 TsaB [Pseudomonadota bacterium]